MMRIGVDTGGTFTDLVCLDDEGLKVHKVRSTPEDPARAILAGIEQMTVGMAGSGEIAEVIHGSTVATNAVLERKGARIALVATHGFEDVLFIARQTRRHLYDLQVEAPIPIVEPELVFGVAERVSHRGEILEPVNEQKVEELAQRLVSEGIECAAVCLLHSYANAAHEKTVEKILGQAGLRVAASHKVLPEYREYERWSTTALNAYVMPIMAGYLTTLESGLGGTRLHVMQSNGGILSAARARETPVRTVLSGPAAGAVGAQRVANASGFHKLILFDMGGTSTDVSLVDGTLSYTSESMVGDFPVRLPMLDIHTVGAGGGSIAYVDSGGSLRVGPRSAGADPGPVCYGRGEELTVSDANLLLGRLPAEYFFGGRMKLDADRARKRAEEFAAKLKMTVERLAEGIVQVANANMERAVRAVSAQRGHDPRDFALFAFGGAGGMHACEIAEKMEIDTVLVPRHAGVLSALGMLLAEARKDYSQTILLPASELTEESMAGLFAPMIARANAELREDGFAETDLRIECLLDVRYFGQSYEIGVPAEPRFEEAFHRRHEAQYGYASPSRPVEVVNLRVNAVGPARGYAFPEPDAEPQPLPSPLMTTKARFDGAWVETPVYRRELLPAGCRGDGPAIMAGNEATIVIPPSFRFEVDGVETLVATRVRASQTQPVPHAADHGRPVNRG
jgi:N-methylhydantoinase A/oxoprolinase/acetone carboxylase beta subunit